MEVENTDKPEMNVWDAAHQKHVSDPRGRRIVVQSSDSTREPHRS